MTNFTDIPWDRITQFGQATMLDQKLFSTSWILGRFCNYKCSYCWPYANSQTPDHQELSTYFDVIDNITEQAHSNGFDKFHWSFSGGEPTAYKNLDKIIAHVDSKESKYTSVHLTTNLSPGMAYWKRWLKVVENLQRTSLTASFHHEFANEQEFGDKILFLTDNNVFVTVNQVMIPEHFDELYNRCQRFAARGINVTLKPQSDSTASHIVDGYTPEMISLMRTGFPQHSNDNEVLQVRLTDDTKKVWYVDQAERFNSFGFNKFKGWNCNSGFQSVIIRGDEVKRSYSCKEESLGTLKSFKLFDSPKQCVTDTCVSSADSKIPKVKDAG